MSACIRIIEIPKNFSIVDVDKKILDPVLEELKELEEDYNTKIDLDNLVEDFRRIGVISRDDLGFYALSSIFEDCGFVKGDRWTDGWEDTMITVDKKKEDDS